MFLSLVRAHWPGKKSPLFPLILLNRSCTLNAIRHALLKIHHRKSIWREREKEMKNNLWRTMSEHMREIEAHMI
jgi:hypothetical protein